MNSVMRAPSGRHSQELPTPASQQREAGHSDTLDQPLWGPAELTLQAMSRPTADLHGSSQAPLVGDALLLISEPAQTPPSPRSLVESEATDHSVRSPSSF